MDVFAQRFNEACRRRLEGLDLSSVLHVDAWIDLRELDLGFADALNRLRPYGEGNPEPVWAAAAVTIVGEPRILKDEHLKLSLASGGTQMEAIGFGLGRRKVPAGSLDVAFTLRRDRYGGRDRLQLHLKDFRPPQEPAG